MCLSIPKKIVKIKGGWATVKDGGHSRKANLSLIKNAKVGDYVLVHADLALNKIEKREAEKILKIINRPGKNNHEHQ